MVMETANRKEMRHTVAEPFDDDWRRANRGTVGGSTASAVMGCSRFKTRAGLWDEMHSVIVDNKLPPRLRENDDMRRGNRFEDTAIKLLAEDLGISITKHPQNEFIMNADCPWAHSLPDGWIGAHIAEVKVPRPGTIAKVNLQGLIEEWSVQGQHNMAVCGAQKCYFGLLDPISALVHSYVLDRDEEYIREMMLAEYSFRQSVIRGERPDQPEDHEVMEEASGILIMDFEAAVQAAETFFRLRDIVTDAKETLEVAKQSLIDLSDDAMVFEVSGVGRFYHKTGKPRRLFNKDAAIAAYPMLADDRYWKLGKASRSFRPYDRRNA